MTNYEKLFGTPERAARTVAALNSCHLDGCDDCVAVDACIIGFDGADDYDALLGWLRGEA